MSIPGSNLLRQAAKVIKFTSVQYFKYAGKTLNARRENVDTYDAAVTLSASVQAVPRAKYMELGLDFQKNYIKMFASKNLIDVQRDYSGDLFVYGGRKYKLIDNTNWYLQDGWATALAIDIGASA